MKKIILIIALSWVGFLNAQTIIPYAIAVEEDYSNGNYIKDTEGKLNPFIGIWVWENSTNTAKLTIKLIKNEQYDCNGVADYKRDVLMGGYKYEESGVVITDKLTFATDHYSNPNIGPIIASLRSDSGLPSISFQITDIAKRKLLKGKMILNANPSLTLLEPLTATMKLVPQRTWTNDPSKVSLPGNTFPFEMILTKQ